MPTKRETKASDILGSRNSIRTAHESSRAVLIPFPRSLHPILTRASNLARIALAATSFRRKHEESHSHANQKVVRLLTTSHRGQEGASA